MSIGHVSSYLFAVHTNGESTLAKYLEYRYAETQEEAYTFHVIQCGLLEDVVVCHFASVATTVRIRSLCG